MTKIQTKICGITRPQDAQLAAQLGADAIGLVFFAGSKRCVTIAQAQAIVRVLPPFVSVVALFVNEPAARIQEILARVPIDVLQFHGDETPAFCQQFHRPYLKAVRVQTPADITAGELSAGQDPSSTVARIAAVDGVEGVAPAPAGGGGGRSRAFLDGLLGNRAHVNGQALAGLGILDVVALIAQALGESNARLEDFGVVGILGAGPGRRAELLLAVLHGGIEGGRITAHVLSADVLTVVGVGHVEPSVAQTLVELEGVVLGGAGRTGGGGIGGVG